MKKLSIIFILFLLVGCVSTKNQKDPTITSQMLSTSNGGRSGVVILINGDSLYFKSSFVLVNLESVIIMDEDESHEFKWRKIRTIHIYNATKQEEYIKDLKKIEKINQGK